MSYDFDVRKIDHRNEKEKLKMVALLNQEGIRLDPFIEYSVGIYRNDDLLATGSFYKNTLRCLAVDSNYQGLGLMNKVVSHLQEVLTDRGEHHFFIYTKATFSRLFEEIGYFTIAKVNSLVVFMENRPDGITAYKNSMKEKYKEAGRVAAIVMNGNPFTKGHLYLVEKAASENDVVHLFMVSEEASIIPFETRLMLITRGVAHLENVVIHPAGAYMISKATFPSYFLKDEMEAVATHAKLDLEIFLKHVVPVLGISKRYVGEEPYCEITRIYIETMKSILEANGIACEVVPRKETEAPEDSMIPKGAISASMVRQCIRENKLEEIRWIVPETTYEYFDSEEGQRLIEIMKNHHGRH